MEFSSAAKMVELGKIKEQEKAMALKIDKLVSNGDLDEYPQRRFFGGCFSFLRKGRSRVANESGMEVRVFGHNATGGSTQANARLEKAAEQMANHADQLYAKASTSREKAKSLMESGKRQEAIMALKRCKALEKQAEVASNTHSAIEQQKDMLESSALQREIASALSASIATTKKKTRGLLEKAETAVDDSAELRDAVEDISEVMGGLVKSDDFDDDDILEELESMTVESQSATVAQRQPETASAETITQEAIVVGIDPSLYPSAPTKKEQRLKLLSSDSSAIEHASSLTMAPL
tara:strand:+ start:3376 stop:4257 length:882 start_codon:yes stop_codon:yes gene_type:complete